MANKPVMIITGSRTGLGRHLSSYYLEKGFNVIGCSRSNDSSELNNYQHYSLDISDETLVKKMFKEIRKKYGRLDFLINNAGISSANHVLLTSLKEVQDVINTNFIGSFLFSRESVKLMKMNKFGRIINISSVHVKLASVGTSVYGASKAAIEQFSKVLSSEIFTFGITVNTLSLSIVENTGMENVLTEKNKLEILNKTISKEQLNINDIVNALNFLISKKSRMITNQILLLGGI